MSRRPRTRQSLFTQIVGVLAILVGVMSPGPAWAQVADRATYTFLLLDQLEYAPGAMGAPLVLDAEGWIGGDFERLWIKVEGEHSTEESEGEGEVQLLYGRMLSPFWDLQVGVRVDGYREAGDVGARALLVLGLQGLAPYWFEIEPALFISQDGDISARFLATYDLLVTQRLIVQPRLELDGALQKVAEFDTGSGLNHLEMGLRLRYEIRREIAPYVGFSWLRHTGEAADLVRGVGRRVGEAVFVAGFRLWR